MTRRKLIAGGALFAGVFAAGGSIADAARGELLEDRDSTQSPSGFGSDDRDLLHYCVSNQGRFSNPAGPVMMERAIAEYARFWEAKTLVLYFHGGLVDKETGLQWAGELLAPYSRSVDRGGDAYPYFFVWRSGAGETALAKLRKRDPEVVLDKVISVHGRLLSSHVPQRDIPAQAQQRVEDRLRLRRDHGLHNTKIEEFLRWSGHANLLRSLWQQMKDATVCAFKGPAETYVGSKMIEQLANHFYARGRYPRITLAGHSAGAIYICEFLKAVHARVKDREDQDRIKFDVVLMAPAVRMDEFARTLDQVCPDQAHARIRNFRMFGLCDERETRDPLIPSSLLNLFPKRSYTSSLLYFISGVLEESDGDTPLLGMQRFFPCTRAFTLTESELRTANRVMSFLFDKKQWPRVVWAPAHCGLGFESAASRHGGMAGEAKTSRSEAFPWEAKTLQSVCYLLRTGNYSGQWQV